MTKIVGIMANGPKALVPNLMSFKHEVDVWVTTDGGALSLMNQALPIDYAVGDFDSVSIEDKDKILKYAKKHQVYPKEKDLTDLEIAILKAFEYDPDRIYIFGATGGRLDHELVNIQLLYKIIDKGIRGIIIDRQNKIELTLPGHYKAKYDRRYPIVSFIPFTGEIKGLSLEGFYYPLKDKVIKMGSTLCVSNNLMDEVGYYSYESGSLLIVKSCEVD